VPLTLQQKASLVLRIAIARFLDDYAAPADEPDKALELARLCILEWHVRIGDDIESHQDLKNYLVQAAGALESLLTGDPALSSERIKEAIAYIRHCATDAQSGNGDGLVRLPPGTPLPCLCGFMELAQRVENLALNHYVNADGSLGSSPALSYKTVLTPDTLRALEPFKVGGGAEIRNTRRVILTVKDVSLSAADLCQIAYVLFHEIVCHGFQGVMHTGAVDAKPQCHWTEGWMDTVAYGLAVAAASGQQRGLQDWLPLTGSDAEWAMGEVHHARYTNPVGLKRQDATERRAARRAFNALRIVFLDAGIASSEADAEALSQKFSFLANAQADTKTLGRLSAALQSVLLGNVRGDDKVYASHACLEFLSHRDLNRLLTILQPPNKP
jgi:hypothetical protein